MKVCILLLLQLLMNSLAFSQPIVPSIITDSKDTLYCWTPQQAKIIAIDLEAGRFADSIITVQDSAVLMLTEQGAVKDSLIARHARQIVALRQLDTLHTKQITDLHQTIHQERERARLKQGLLAGLAVLASFIGIIAQ
ncbi:MAG: hypothetical protein AAGB22_05275 [Bacteroidota bacterium]